MSNITAMRTSVDGQARIEGYSKPLPEDYTDEQWRECYVNFGGYFGHYNPSVFAAAPDLEKALKAMLEAFYLDPMEADTAAAVQKAQAALDKASAEVLPYVEAA